MACLGWVIGVVLLAGCGESDDAPESRTSSAPVATATQARPDPRQPVPPCRPQQLQALAHAGSPGDGTLEVGLRDGESPCRLHANAVVALVDGNLVDIPLQRDDSRATAHEIIIHGEKGFPDGGALIFEWSNWCGEPPAAPITASVRDEGWEVELIATPDDGGYQEEIAAPDCLDAAGPSVLNTGTGFEGLIYAADARPCEGEDVTVRTDWFHYEPPDRETNDYVVRGGVWIQNPDSVPCSLVGYSDFTAFDSSGEVVDFDFSTTIPRVSSSDSGGAVIAGGAQLYLRFEWDNWCGAPISGPLDFAMTLPEPQGVIRWTDAGTVEPTGLVLTPACVEPGEPSTFTIY